LANLGAAGYHAVAVETSADATNLFEWEPTWPVCLVFGHEKDGVSSDLASQVNTVIRIPMLGHKRSLNVATAAGVVLYELLRRRLFR
jgi:tRNA G18 (ribose-2'-O)-methylase SpoU